MIDDKPVELYGGTNKTVTETWPWWSADTVECKPILDLSDVVSELKRTNEKLDTLINILGKKK